MPGRFLRKLRPLPVFAAAGLAAGCFFSQAGAAESELLPGEKQVSRAC